MKGWAAYETSRAMLPLKLKPISCWYGEIYANVLITNELSKPEPICLFKSSADMWKNGLLSLEENSESTVLDYHACQDLMEGTNALKQ